MADTATGGARMLSVRRQATVGGDADRAPPIVDWPVNEEVRLHAKRNPPHL